MLIWMSGIERISPDFYEASTIDSAAIGLVLCLYIVLIFTVCNIVIKNDDLEF